MASLCGRWAHCLCYAAVLLGLATLVAGERTDSTKSTASGNGLQYATAGVLAEFTVTAKVCTAPPGAYVASQHLLHDKWACCHLWSGIGCEYAMTLRIPPSLINIYRRTSQVFGGHLVETSSS